SRYDDDYDDDIDPVAYTEERRGTPAGMPAGSHVEQAQKEVPAPHIPAPQVSSPQPSQSGIQQAPAKPESAIPGPHIPPASSRETVKDEAKQSTPAVPAPPPKGKG